MSGKLWGDSGRPGIFPGPASISQSPLPAGIAFRFLESSLLKSKWDTSNDKELSYEEVRQGLRTTGHFQKWDRNSDGKLDEDELAHGLTQALDKDKDNRISLAEYDAGWAHLTGDIDADRTTQPTRQTE